MKYHDNDVFLRLSPDFTLVSGSYTVESYSISSGQDPDGHIYAGLVVSCGADGKLTFSVGRDKTEQVANWFNLEIPASQNTFNHNADELNFAFLGTLVLTFTGGTLGSTRETFTFSGVALAQGSNSGNENWWFGGKNCFNIGNDQVSGYGLNSRGIRISSVFLRGDGNDDSTVQITPTLIDMSSWMGELNNNTRLDNIMMPGSHDAGMSELHHCNPVVVSEQYTQTQSGTVGQQLLDGSRYFDIRVDYDHDVLVTYHRDGAFGCNGQDLQVILDETTNFLRTHPTETAILKFSHIRDYDGHDPAVTKQKINDLLNTYITMMYTNSSANVNLATVALSAVRGKMVLVFDYDDYINPATGRFRYKNGSTTESGANITVYDHYSDTDDYVTMRDDQLQKWAAHAGLSTGHFFLLSWTLTASPPGSSIRTLAGQANSHLAEVLHDQISNKGAQKPNIVYIDFLDATLVETIVQYNF